MVITVWCSWLLQSSAISQKQIPLLLSEDGFLVEVSRWKFLRKSAVDLKKILLSFLYLRNDAYFYKVQANANKSLYAPAAYLRRYLVIRSRSRLPICSMSDIDHRRAWCLLLLSR